MKILNLDIKSKNTNLGQVEKCDTVKFITTLEEKDYSNSTIRILGKKADKTFTEQIVQATGNKIEATLKDQFTSCEGIVRIEVNIAKNGQEWTSNENYFYVSNTLNGEIIESKDSIDTLEKVNKYVENATTELDEFKIIKDDLNSSNETMKVDEESRVTNEIIRGNSENIRITSEKERASSEEIRNENELERVQAESDRKTNENNRRLAETLRNNAETTRATAEIQRQNAFETNEEIRNENEKLRIANELKRENTDKKHNSNENERKANETTRVEAEKLRVQEEAKRKNNEISREKAEEVRQETYTDFNNAEHDRKENETTRIKNEKLRITAEENRKITFETNETDRQNVFETNENTRASAFNSSESTRQTSFEANETTRMNKFNEVEKARDVIFEANEVTREENENLRKTNETAREKAELKRIENENARAVNETKRVTAETTRTESETARVEAEKLREQRFEEMEGSSALLEMTQEVKEARTDYFGKEHASLKEKEDREFEFVHIDNSKGMFVESSTNTGYMKIENSIEGKARDSVIKGRTLQNLAPKNLSNTSKDSNGYFTSISNSYDYLSEDLTLFKPNTEYTIIIDILENDMTEILRFGGGNTTDLFSETYTIPLNKTGIFIFTRTSRPSLDGVKYPVWIKNKPDATGHFKLRLIILEKNNTQNPPTTYFEGIKSLGEEENKISILSTGKNLMNPHFELNMAEGIYGFVKFQNHNEKHTLQIYEKDSSVSVDGMFFGFTGNGSNADEGYSWIVSNNGISSKEVISQYNYLSFYPKNLKTWEAINKRFNFQLEEGTIVTPYEHYKEDKKDILIPVSGGAKGFSILADESYGNGDYLQHFTEFNLSNVDRPFTIMKNNEADKMFWLCNASKYGIDGAINSNLMLCDKIPCYNALWDPNVSKEIKFGIDISGTDSINIRLPMDKFENEQKCLEFINTCNVVCKLKEPILHKAEVVQNNNPTTFKEITHVSCLNKIAPSSMSGKFPIDTAATLSRLNVENKNLEKENIELKNDLLEQAEHFNNKDKEINDYTLDMDFKVCLMEMDLEDIKLQLGDGINVKK